MRGLLAPLAGAMLLASPLLAAPKPKNVILLIGDGMGVAQVSIMAHLRAEKFRLGTMPVTGFSMTRSADRAVTDSAAGAAALATGFKTNYEMVSVDPVTLAPQETVLERAEKKGKATGLVTTGYFFDATPAVFAAHAKHRGEFLSIAQQMLKSGAEVILGAGGTRFGKPPLPPLEEVVRDSGYTVVTTRAELDAAKGAPRVLAVFPDQLRDLDYPDAPLAVLAKFALDKLQDDPDGFFVMIEHEGIDSASHTNSSAELGLAVRSFDEAVGVALDFAKRRGDTLVVVTADHETGGLRISETRTTARPRSEWSTSEHTAAAVPVFAFGPGSEVFAGWQDNTAIGQKLLALQ